jgi:hypothetical protein
MIRHANVEERTYFHECLSQPWSVKEQDRCFVVRDHKALRRARPRGGLRRGLNLE